MTAEPLRSILMRCKTGCAARTTRAQSLLEVDMASHWTCFQLMINLDEMQDRLRRPDYTRVAQSLLEVDMASALDLFSTYAGRASDLSDWLKDAAINRDRNLRMQYLAGTGLNLDESAAIYSEILTYRRFPEDLFTSARGHVDAVRESQR